MICLGCWYFRSDRWCNYGRHRIGHSRCASKPNPTGIFSTCRALIAFSGIARRIGQVQETTMQERQIKSAAVPHLQELTGRIAIVTGSTSGIGLGIAQAFAASGMHVMLNGFGDEKEIRKIRADMEEAHGIKTAYSAADMSKPDEVARMVEDTRSLLGKSTCWSTTLAFNTWRRLRHFQPPSGMPSSPLIFPRLFTP